MQFDNSFSVAKPIDEVWATMLDLERVIPCVPDAKVLEKTSDEERHGRDQDQARVDVDELLRARPRSSSATTTPIARCSRRQGEGGRRARATPRAKVEIQLTEAGDGTEAKLHSDVIVTGKAAQMGEGIIAAVTEAMIKPVRREPRPRSDRGGRARV